MFNVGVLKNKIIFLFYGNISQVSIFNNIRITYYVYYITFVVNINNFFFIILCIYVCLYIYLFIYKYIHIINNIGDILL